MLRMFTGFRCVSPVIIILYQEEVKQSEIEHLFVACNNSFTYAFIFFDYD